MKILNLIKSNLIALINCLRSDYCCIITLHRVTSDVEILSGRSNDQLIVKENDLKHFIESHVETGWNFISLDELSHRLKNNISLNKSISLTSDDGYLDNYLHLVPLVTKMHVPLTIFISNSFPNRTIKLWWHVLEDAIDWKYGKRDDSSFNFLFLEYRDILIEKYSGHYDNFFNDYFDGFLYSWENYAINLCMNWTQVAEISKNRLIKIGNHSFNHFPLSMLSDEELKTDIEKSIHDFASHNIANVNSYCYPFGTLREASLREFNFIKDFGFNIAVTTNQKIVLPLSRLNIHSLPRLNFTTNLNLNNLVRPIRLIKNFICLNLTN